MITLGQLLAFPIVSGGAGACQAGWNEWHSADEIVSIWWRLSDLRDAILLERMRLTR